MIKKIFSTLRVRTLKSNFKQFLSSFVIVLLATMLISGFFANSSTLDRTINTYFEETNLADMWIYTNKITDADTAFFDENNISYSKRFYAETSAKISSTNIQNNGKIYVANGKISNPIIESGQKGCLIDKNVAKNMNIRANREYISFTLKYPVSTPLGTRVLDIEIKQIITGTMSFDECADTYSSWPIFFDEEVFLRKVNEGLAKYNTQAFSIPEITSMDSLYNQILIKTENYDETAALINSHYSSGETDSSLIYMLSRDGIESVVLLNGEIEQSKKMIYVFPVIFLVVSILVILTTLDQLVIQEKTRIGTLKSIGIPDQQILWHYTSFGTLLCFFVSLIGIILGTLIIPNIMFIKYNLVYSIPEEYIHLSVPYLLLLAVLVGMVLIGFLVSLYACFGILHKKPVECLRFEVGSGAKKLKKSSGKFKRVPLSVKMAVRNVRLKPIRTIMASIGIAGCVALLLCGFGIKDTLNYSTSNDLEHVFKYDVTTTYNSSDFEQKLIENVEEVDFFEKYQKYYLEVVGENTRKNVNVYKIVQDSKLSSIVLNENDVCLSENIASDLGLNVGSKFEIVIDETKVELEVTKLVKTSFFNGVYICKDLGFSGLVATNGMWIKCTELIEGTTSKINKINGTNTAYSMANLRRNVENKISSINVMTGTLKTFAIALAIVVLLNLIFLILKERIREIATLKVLGRDNLSIGISVFFEILFMSIIGSAVGMCLGYPLLVLVLSINKVEVMNYLFHINVLSYFLSLAIIFVTIVLVSLFCQIKIKKIDMIESLKSVE